MKLMRRSLKVLLAPVLGVALLAPWANADGPKNSDSPVPAKKVEPKTTKDTKEAPKVAKKAKPAKPVKHTRKAHKHIKKAHKYTKKAKPAKPVKHTKKAPAVNQAGR